MLAAHLFWFSWVALRFFVGLSLNVLRFAWACLGLLGLAWACLGLLRLA